jgi:DNA invertase Pin-like site-specific DNA recombinase
LDATAFPPQTIFIFTCNTTEGLEARFLSRTRQLEFSSYGIAAEATRLLETIWLREANGALGPNFARIVKESSNNIRDALMCLEIELLAIWELWTHFLGGFHFNKGSLKQLKFHAQLSEGANNMRVAIYARVSTQNGQDPEMQTRELRDYCERRGWAIENEYVDVGVSGAKESRPELNRLMADAKRRKLDLILVWKLDRFGRSLRHLVNALAELEAVGVAFVSLTDNLDLSTPSGRLMFQVIAAMSEFERELIRERVRSGMSNAKAKGKSIGRPKLAVDSLEIARLRESGATWRAIAKATGISVGSVYKARSKRPS